MTIVEFSLEGARSGYYCENHADQVEDMEMPPPGKRDKYPALTDAQVATLKTWIDEGAHWPEETILKP